MTTQLVEVRVSEVQPGDVWLLEGAWVVVTKVDVGHPDDRVWITYTMDDEDFEYGELRGFEVAVVKRDV